MEAFSKETPAEILAELEKTAEGREFLRWLDEYKREFGHKALYSHEYVYPTWYERSRADHRCHPGAVSRPTAPIRKRSSGCGRIGTRRSRNS